MGIGRFFKRLFAVSEVDGITFYSDYARERYLEKKRVEREREEKGLKQFTVYSLTDMGIGKCIMLLEGAGVFDYEIHRDCGYYGNWVTYWAKHIVVVPVEKSV